MSEKQVTDKELQAALDVVRKAANEVGLEWRSAATDDDWVPADARFFAVEFRIKPREPRTFWASLYDALANSAR